MDFRRLSLLSCETVAQWVCSLPFSVSKGLGIKGGGRFLQLLLMATLASTMVLPYRWVFALVLVGDVLGILLSAQAKRSLKAIDVLIAVFTLEVVAMFAILSQTEELAECMIVMVALVFFYFLLCLYVKREYIERMFVLCCFILSLERLLTITISEDRWHDNRHATFQLLVFAIPLCLKRMIRKKYPWKVKAVYAFLTVLISVTIAIPFFYDGFMMFNLPAIINTWNDYRLPLGEALLEFVQNVLTTISSLHPIFSVSAALSILLLVILIVTESLSEKNNPLTILAATLAVAGGGVSGFLAENIRIGLWENINLLIIFWALIAVVTKEEENI